MSVSDCVFLDDPMTTPQKTLHLWSSTFFIPEQPVPGTEAAL
jgi:hypothetical protein